MALQCDVQLLGGHDGHIPVVLAADDQGWRLHLVEKPERRDSVPLFAVVLEPGQAEFLMKVGAVESVCTARC